MKRKPPHVTALQQISNAVDVIRRASLELDPSETASAQELIATLGGRPGGGTTFHDEITGLATRALFEDRLTHAMDVSARRGTATGLLLLDLDRLESIAERLGQEAGDAMLRDVGAELRSCGRSYDSIARLGGDEFGILLEDTTAEAARAVAHRIHERLSRMTVHRESPEPLGISFGIAISGIGCHTSDELVRRADIARSTAKGDRSRPVAMFGAGMENAFDEEAPIDLEAVAADLQRGLDQDEFVVYYQPIVDLEKRQIIGIEALVRWNHSERGLIAPDAFIPAAEATGLIVPLGTRVLEVACAQTKRWRRELAGATDLKIAVNISARQLDDLDLVGKVASILEDTGLPSDALTLEVTESIFVDGNEHAGAQLDALKSLGVSLAIDDFGTGFSSLSFIHNYPFDILKIDRSFIMGLGTAENGGAVVKTMIALSKQLSLRVVAEGIESQAELAQLRALRCGFGQGFLFARPLPADDLAEFLASEDGANMSVQH